MPTTSTLAPILLPATLPTWEALEGKWDNDCKDLIVDLNFYAEGDEDAEPSETAIALYGLLKAELSESVAQEAINRLYWSDGPEDARESVS